LPVFHHLWNKTQFIKHASFNAGGGYCPSNADACAPGETIHLWGRTFAHTGNVFVGIIAHELAHVWDWRTQGLSTNGTPNQRYAISAEMGRRTGSKFNDCDRPQCSAGRQETWLLGPSGKNVRTSYAGESPLEDWAVSVELVVAPQDFWLRRNYTLDQWAVRKSFVEQKIQNAIREVIGSGAQ
jgi:hypothetical protein